MLKLMSIFLLIASFFNCSPQKKIESFPFGADVIIKKDGEKIVGQFNFYSPISEILNGKENRGFGKSPLIVDFPKLNGIEMQEKKINDSYKVYLAQIESLDKDYTVTFSRKDGEYIGILHLTENDLGKNVTVNFKKNEK